MNTMNKIFTLLAALLLSAPAFAADGDIKKTTVDGVEWAYTIISEADKYCDLGGYTYNDAGDAIYYPAIDESITGALNIPSTLDGYTVGSIGIEGFRGCKISSLTIPEGVTYIGDYAFSGCSQLTTVICDALPFDISEKAFECITDQVTVYFPVDYGVQFKSRTGWNKLSKWFEKGVEERKQALSEQMYALMDQLEYVHHILSEKATESEAPELYNELKDLEARVAEMRYRIEDARTMEVVSRELPPALEETRAQMEYLMVKIENYQPSENIAINKENFPDQYFREYVSSYIDTDKDGNLSIEEREAVTEIIKGSYYQRMADMTGIEYFTNLETLNLYSTHVKSLDLSKNTALKSFISNQNTSLESLDISKNTALEILNVSGTKLTSLDVTHLTNLKELHCYGLKLATLDVSNCKSLEVLECAANELKELDLTNNLSLKRLNCASNKLTSLDVTKLTALTTLYIGYNPLTAIDLSNNLALEFLSCFEVNLKVLDVSIFTELQELHCPSCGLTNLDVSKNTKLQTLNCDYNPLTKLDISKNTELTQLYCRGGRISAEGPLYQLTELDVTQNTKLEALFCSGNLFTSLDVSNNTALQTLECTNNQLTTLDVSKNTLLRTLYCGKNQLAALDVLQNTNLYSLTCSDNQLTSIDISENTELSVIDCSNNQIETLDVSNNEKIGSVYCERNRIKSIKVSCKNTRLGRIHCPGNELKGAAIDSLISNLPVNTYGSVTVIDTLYNDEKNVCTKTQVAAFKEKGWTVRVRHSAGASVYGDEYEGSDPVNTDLNPVDGGDKIDIGTEINTDTNLDGNVVGNILYNISSGNGEFNAQEGCLVINKATSDETMSSLEGKDIFGEDVKDNFTGIVLKVAEGSGKVAIEAETTGPMVLKMKVGNEEPLEMEFEGKLKVKFPYNVTEETYVYIYGSTKAAQQAKGMRRANGTDGTLKIFGIEIEKNPTAIDDIFAADKPMDIYTLSGQKVRSGATSLQGLPAGVYIVGGKKVVISK